jgi:nitrate/TMAO reductase-like tetraheme cytochrome c subunit
MEPKKVNKKLPLIPVILGAAVLGLLLAGGGFAFAASQESHDPFCASCHTQPESTFFERSQAAQPVDLASYHTTQETRCIDCHSGEGVTGRVQAELMGAHNALAWYTGTAVQPAVLTTPISDANCLKCHQDVTSRGYQPKAQIAIQGIGGGREGFRGGREEEGGNNHWHEQLAKWQATSANAGTCTSCHSGHVTDGTAQNGFMNNQTVQATCDACHQVMRRERD